ncbi:MAG: hypothetical protein E6767_07260 [Dysgonomonas sp.]|nr:hypothetical protein [Dysgonomonas sp.]
MKNLLIRCPKCKWEPSAEHTWECSCGHEWNTFETGGCCPKCGRVWKHTQCYPDQCNQWSLHIDWYGGFDDKVKQLIESIIREKQNI